MQLRSSTQRRGEWCLEICSYTRGWTNLVPIDQTTKRKHRLTKKCFKLFFLRVTWCPHRAPLLKGALSSSLTPLQHCHVARNRGERTPTTHSHVRRQTRWPACADPRCNSTVSSAPLLTAAASGYAKEYDRHFLDVYHKLPRIMTPVLNGSFVSSTFRLSADEPRTIFQSGDY